MALHDNVIIHGGYDILQWFSLVIPKLKLPKWGWGLSHTMRNHTPPPHTHRLSIPEIENKIAALIGIVIQHA